MINAAWRKSFAMALSAILFIALVGLAFLLDLQSRSYIYSLVYAVILCGVPVLTFLLVNGTQKDIVLQVARVLVSALVGFYGLLPLGAIFDKMNWPIFHSWGL